MKIVQDQVDVRPLFTAGTVTVLISAFGDLGVYNLAATDARYIDPRAR